MLICINLNFIHTIVGHPILWPCPSTVSRGWSGTRYASIFYWLAVWKGVMIFFVWHNYLDTCIIIVQLQCYSKCQLFNNTEEILLNSHDIHCEYIYTKWKLHVICFHCVYPFKNSNMYTLWLMFSVWQNETRNFPQIFQI